MRHLVARLALAAVTLLPVACASNVEDEVEATEGSADALRSYEDAPLERPEVGLLTMNGATCTGTLIGSRTVLTAAHCVKFASAVAAPSAPPIGTCLLYTSRCV